MNSLDWISLIAIFVSVIIIAFLAGIEIAFVSANKLSIELNKRRVPLRVAPGVRSPIVRRVLLELYSLELTLFWSFMDF